MKAIIEKKSLALENVWFRGCLLFPEVEEGEDYGR